MSLKRCEWCSRPWSRHGGTGVAVAPWRTPYKLALCGEPFPAFTGNPHIGNRFSQMVDLSQSPAESTLRCCRVHTEKEEGTVGGGQLWNSSPSSCRVWGISFIIFSFFMSTYFSLSLSLALSFFLPFTCRSHVSLLTLCLVFQMSTHTSQPAWRSYPSPSGRVRTTKTCGQMELSGSKHKYSMQHTITACF